jgi:ParB-like chromosome segregation protein Spo0J
MKPDPKPAIEPMAVARLRPCAHNARTHSRRQIRQIADSIAKFGFTNPVLIGDDDEIIAGHGRVAAAKLLGLSRVPTVRLSHLDAAKRRAYGLADNKLALNAGWDRDMLATELRALVDQKFDVEATGFSLNEVRVVVGRNRAVEGPDSPDAPARAVSTVSPRPQAPASRGQAHLPATSPASAQQAAVTRPADAWLLGRHRLLCADPGDVTVLDRMLQEERLVFIALDPADCDRIAGHFRQLTGHDATLAETGQSFAEVAAQRATSAAATAAAPRDRASRKSA